MSVWAWLPLGYLITILMETPVLLLGLSPKHPVRVKLFAAVWLTAITYPVVTLVFPHIAGRYYLWIAEIFAPICECVAFVAAFRRGRNWGDRSLARDGGAIIAANLTSFAAGWLLWWN